MKHIQNIGFYLTLLSLVFGCKSGSLENKHAFKVITKTYYNWTGGQPGVKGTNVVIKMLNVDVNNFKADSIYFSDKGVKAEMHVKKDTLILMGYFSTRRVPTQIEIEPRTVNKEQNATTKTPYTLKANQAILIYYSNDKKKVLKLYDLVKTNNKYYP